MSGNPLVLLCGIRHTGMLAFITPWGNYTPLFLGRTNNACTCSMFSQYIYNAYCIAGLGPSKPVIRSIQKSNDSKETSDQRRGPYQP